jgi:hypothetical protein
MRNLKYVQLFENWKQSGGDDYKYFDNITYETASNILNQSHKKEKATEEEIKKIEEALKKYLRTDILKFKLEYLSDKERIIFGEKYPAREGFYIRMENRDSLSETMYFYFEKFEDNQYFFTFTLFPLPDYTNPLGLVINGRFGFLVYGLDKLDVWAKEASPINDRLETYQCLSLDINKIKDRFNTYGELKVYTEGLKSDVITKIKQMYPSIENTTSDEIYLFKDNKHWGTIKIMLKSNLHVTSVEDLRMLLELAPKTTIYGIDSNGNDISSYSKGFKTI